VTKYRNRKQLDIWKLRDPKEPWKRNIFGYELDENGQKIMDTVAHVTVFDSHPFFQQSFVKAAEFLVKIGKADKADFDFMKEMKRKRDRFSSETLEQIKAYTELELRYLAQVVTELRQIRHDIKLDFAPNMKPRVLLSRPRRRFPSSISIISSPCTSTSRKAIGKRGLYPLVSASIPHRRDLLPETWRGMAYS
jgi:hypothetical protein